MECFQSGGGGICQKNMGDAKISWGIGEWIKAMGEGKNPWGSAFVGCVTEGCKTENR